jgi:hypothetical protein
VGERLVSGPPDPDSLAATTANLHQQRPDLLGSLLAGERAASAACWAAVAAQAGGLLGGAGGGGNPVMKAALGGIAAMAAERLMNRQGGPGVQPPAAPDTGVPPTRCQVGQPGRPSMLAALRCRR